MVAAGVQPRGDGDLCPHVRDVSSPSFPLYPMPGSHRRPYSPSRSDTGLSQKRAPRLVAGRASGSVSGWARRLTVRVVRARLASRPRSFAAWGCPRISGSTTSSASSLISSPWYARGRLPPLDSTPTRAPPPPFFVVVCTSVTSSFRRGDVFPRHTPHSHGSFGSQVPQPVHAVLLLFPITDKSERAKEEEGAKIKAEGQTCSDKASERRAERLNVVVLSFVAPLAPNFACLFFLNTAFDPPAGVLHEADHRERVRHHRRPACRGAPPDDTLNTARVNQK